MKPSQWIKARASKMARLEYERILRVQGTAPGGFYPGQILTKDDWIKEKSKWLTQDAIMEFLDQVVPPLSELLVEGAGRRRNG